MQGTSPVSNTSIASTMNRKKILQAYEQMAEAYDALIDHKPHNAYYDRPNTLGLLPAVRGRDILDAACGPGKYAEILLEQGARVTGVDLSPRMIALAKARNPEAGTFFVHDMAEPFHMLGAASFDIVICALAMHYLEDWTPCLQEFFRLLRPGGRLILSIEHPFFAYTYFDTQKYFDVEPVSAVWKGFGMPIEMHSFRRPLEACLMPLIQNGFMIDRVLEPRPLPEFEAYDPKHFRELNEFPAFLCLRAVRKA